jgi:hypothetical protein
MLIIVFAAGCSVSGKLYTKSVMPFSEDFNNTPAGSKFCVVDRPRITEPITGYDIYVEWTEGKIVDAARRAGMTKIYYADEETFSILFNLYERKRLILYGD